jgi:hypothetical protein
MLRELIVAGGETEPVLPEADGTITARDYAFDLDLQAGDRTINFVNEGPDQMHYSTIGVYPKGIEAAEAEAAFKAVLQPGRPPEGLPSVRALGFSGIFSEGLGGRFELDTGTFRSGRTYLFACYATDRDSGRTHARAYNMYSIVTIE